MKNKKPMFKLWEVLLVAFVGSVVMSLATGYLIYNTFMDKNVYIKSNDDNVNLFLDAYNSIIDNYYGDIDTKGLIDSAISGMTNYLEDPYTTYLNETNKDMLLDSLNGKYNGIGVEISQEDEESSIIIVSVFDDTPAFKAGLKQGDKLTYINGKSLEGLKSSDAVNLIKSSQDGKVVIKAIRNNIEHEFKLELTDVNIPITYSEIFFRSNKRIGFLGLEKFTSTAGVQFKEELLKLEKEGIDSLIIDLRNNTGGYLSEATSISELFLKEGSVIYSLKTKIKTTSYKDKTEENRTYPVVVLINNASASASEILAGALKHNISATMIGETTYGKGKVQQTSNLTDGSMIKYTSAEWLMPNGKGIDKIGIKPDIEVKLSEDYKTNQTKENDNQLQKALEHLSK